MASYAKRSFDACGAQGRYEVDTLYFILFLAS